MEDHAGDHLHILGQLAREYEQKYNELETVIRDAQPDTAIHQLHLRSELTTKQFRTAQQVLLSHLFSRTTEGEKDETCRAAITLCRCFDEMRILFQALLDLSPKAQE